MGLLKKKGILVANDFSNHNNPFYAENKKLEIGRNDSLPNDQSNVLVAKSQAVFYALTNVFNKLVDNDVYISRKLESMMSLGIPKDRIADAFRQDIHLSAMEAMNYYEDAYKKHIDEWHNSQNDKVVQLSTIWYHYMHQDFGNIDIARTMENFVKEQYVNTSYTMSSDVLISCEYDDSENVKYPTNYVNVQVMNDETMNVFGRSPSNSSTLNDLGTLPSTAESKYIYKRWMSGLKELLIYIPSTFTKYNSKLPNTSPKAKTTWIKVTLNGRHFQLNHIFNMQIRGQSLPLGISMKEGRYFQDCPQPSLVRTMCIAPIGSKEPNNVQCVFDENTNYYTLYFCCYGTDAQAIQIFAD